MQAEHLKHSQMKEHSPVQRVNPIWESFKEFEASFGTFHQATSLVDHGHRYNITEHPEVSTVLWHLLPDVLTART